MLTRDEWRALQNHAALIDRHEAALLAERDRLQSPHEARVDELWERAGQRPYNPADRWILLPHVVRGEDSLEAQNLVQSVADALRAYDAEHRPAVEPYDTPAKLVAWIEERLEILRIQDRIRRRPPEGDLPAYENEAARKVYDEACERVLAFKRVVPRLRELLPPQNDAILGLQDIRALFTAIPAESKESQPAHIEPPPGNKTNKFAGPGPAATRTFTVFDRAIAAAGALAREGKRVSVKAACERAGVDRSHLIKRYPGAVQIIKEIAAENGVPKRGYSIGDGRTRAVPDGSRQ